MSTIGELTIGQLMTDRLDSFCIMSNDIKQILEIAKEKYNVQLDHRLGAPYEVNLKGNPVVVTSWISVRQAALEYVENNCPDASYKELIVNGWKQKRIKKCQNTQNY